MKAGPLRFAFFAVVAFVLLGAARAETGDVETTWRLLDYIAVDYAGAVAHGQVSSPSEYAEQKEFAATVAEKLQALPPKPEKETLLGEADRLKRDRRKGRARTGCRDRAPLGGRAPCGLSRAACAGKSS